MPDLKNTIKETAVKLVITLSSRNRDIISRRFGLKTGKKETLESIGQSYSITRERVRQIEEASLKQIRENISSANGGKIKPFVALAENILDQAGGVLKEEEFFDRFFQTGSDRPTAKETANAALVFILDLDGKLRRNIEDEQSFVFWGLSDAHIDAFKNSVAVFVKSLEKNKTPISETALADFSKKAGVSPKYSSPASLTAIMSISKEVGKNIFGQVGLTSWAEIKPRGVRDKSYLVLKKSGKPKHFREITQLINVTFGNRRANVQTIHNELIKDDRFVLVGRGMYGLAEWGYKAGTVKDVLVDLLRSSQKPVKRNEIIAQVLAHRMVKENTILLNLQDSKTFKKTDEGYTLA